MASGYDMCVDYDVLCTIEDKLQKIEYDLNASTEKMSAAIQKSQDFLAGHQFEKARNTTLNCINQTRVTGTNLKAAQSYIRQLRNAIEEYEKCIYAGET